MTLDLLRQAKPEVQAELTRPQNTIKNYPWSACRAKTADAQQHHCACLHPENEEGMKPNQSSLNQSHDLSRPQKPKRADTATQTKEAQLAQPSQGASYRSYKEDKIASSHTQDKLG